MRQLFCYWPNIPAAVAGVCFSVCTVWWSSYSRAVRSQLEYSAPPCARLSFVTLVSPVFRRPTDPADRRPKTRIWLKLTLGDHYSSTEMTSRRTFTARNRSSHCTWYDYNTDFYRATLSYRGICCPFVCPSVTSRCFTKTAKPRITQATPHDSPVSLVCWCQRSRRNSNGVSVQCLRYVYAWIRFVILTIFSKMKDFGRSQPVTYSVNVEISRKRCQIVSLLLQKTNRKWYLIYRIEAIPMTLNYLQSHSPTASLFKCDFSYSCEAVDKTNWQRVARSLCGSGASCYSGVQILFVLITWMWNDDSSKLLDIRNRPGLGLVGQSEMSLEILSTTAEL